MLMKARHLSFADPIELVSNWESHEMAYVIQWVRLGMISIDQYSLVHNKCRGRQACGMYLKLMLAQELGW